MNKEWQELSRQEIFKKYGRKIERVDFKLPNSVEADYYIKREDPASATVALTVDNEVVLVRHFRPGPKLVMTELPGGYVDPGEEPAVAARREFVEETGYDGEFEFVGTCFDDAYSTMERYCFVARNCKKIGEPQHTETEQTEVVLLKQDEFRQLLRSGKMTDVEVGYLGLDHLGLL
jgi:ADP-ribose pyrophosphatase